MLCRFVVSFLSEGLSDVFTLVRWPGEVLAVVSFRRRHIQLSEDDLA
jgi:hypothetical protein